MWPAGCNTRIITGNACRHREGFGGTTVSSFPRKACPRGDPSAGYVLLRLGSRPRFREGFALE
jgi:hypothetical protein